MAGTLKFEESIFQKLFRNILQKGEIPSHIAFVLDGNRRYARERNMDIRHAYRKAFDKFHEIVKCGIICGIQEVTAYIFSINNFDRTAEEVSPIMEILKERFEYFIEHPEEQHGICYRFVGEWSLFPESLRPVMAKLMLMTKGNTKIVVNYAFAYSGRNEIISGVNTLLTGLHNNCISLECLNETLVENSLHVVPLKPVDLLIRTSECRLSDFLTWESSDGAVLCFRDEYWPTFSYWKLLATIFYYQINIFPIRLQSKGSRTSSKDVPANEQTLQSNVFLQKNTDLVWKYIKALGR